MKGPGRALKSLLGALLSGNKSNLEPDLEEASVGDHVPQLPTPPLCLCGHPVPPAHPCSEAGGLAPRLNTRQKILCPSMDAWQASVSLQSLKSESSAGFEGMTARNWSIKSNPPSSRSAASRNRGRLVSSCCVSLPCLSHTSCSSGVRSRKETYYKVAKLTWKLLTTLRILKPPRYMACTLSWPRCPVNQHGWLWDEYTPVSWSWKVVRGQSALRHSTGHRKRWRHLPVTSWGPGLDTQDPPSLASLSAGLDSLDADIHVQFQAQFLSPFSEAFLISPVSVHPFPLYDTRWINYSWISSPSNNSEKLISD